MAEPLKKVETEALELSEKDRAELARVLLLSLDEEEDEGNLKIWAEEAERRYEEIRSGKVETIPHAVVIEQLRNRSQ